MPDPLAEATRIVAAAKLRAANPVAFGFAASAEQATRDRALSETDRWKMAVRDHVRSRAEARFRQDGLSSEIDVQLLDVARISFIGLTPRAKEYLYRVLSAGTEL